MTHGLSRVKTQIRSPPWVARRHQPHHPRLRQGAHRPGPLRAQRPPRQRPPQAGILRPEHLARCPPPIRQAAGPRRRPQPRSATARQPSRRHPPRMPQDPHTLRRGHRVVTPRNPHHRCLTSPRHGMSDLRHGSSGCHHCQSVVSDACRPPRHSPPRTPSSTASRILTRTRSPQPSPCPAPCSRRPPRPSCPPRPTPPRHLVRPQPLPRPRPGSARASWNGFLEGLRSANHGGRDPMSRHTVTRLTLAGRPPILWDWPGPMVVRTVQRL
jgi:hypothetical protein